MKYNLTSVNIFSNGAISIDYRKLDDEGKYLGSVGNDSNLSTEVKREIYESIHRIEALLNGGDTSPKNKDDADKSCRNQIMDDVLEKLSACDDVLKLVSPSDLQEAMCSIEQNLQEIRCIMAQMKEGA